jgi:hypothetical protein
MTQLDDAGLQFRAKMERSARVCEKRVLAGKPGTVPVIPRRFIDSADFLPIRATLPIQTRQLIM